VSLRQLLCREHRFEFGKPAIAGVCDAGVSGLPKFTDGYAESAGCGAAALAGGAMDYWCQSLFSDIIRVAILVSLLSNNMIGQPNADSMT
jgi:hypothetical protein